MNIARPHLACLRRPVVAQLEPLEPRTLLSATLDLVTLHEGLNQISVTANRGDGTFGAPVVGASTIGAGQTVLVDLDRDGELDVVVRHDGATSLSALYGRGNGTFTAPQAIDTGIQVGAFAVADLNADGLLDLVAAPTTLGDLVLLLGKTDGTFDESEPEEIDINRVVTAMVVGDVDRDDRPDILAVSRADDALTVLYNRGVLDFTRTASFPAGDGPTSLALGDLNRDRRVDVVVTNPEAGRITVLLNAGAGEFFIEDSVPTLNQPNSVAIGLLDDDRDPDVVVGDIGGTNRLAVLLNQFRVRARDNDEKFFLLSANPVVPVGSPVSVVLADAENDGDLDFFTANGLISSSSEQSISLFLNNGNGTFQLPNSAGRNLLSQSLAVGDVDGDRYADAVSIGSVFSAVVLGDGEGDFVIPATTNVGTGPGSAVFGNFDNDGEDDPDDNELARLGTTDIVALNTQDNTISILLNRGDGRFTIDRTDGTVAVGRGPRQIAAARLDADNNADLVITNATDRSITILRGATNGTFGLRSDIAIDADVDGVALGDVNGDGRTDIVVGNRDTSAVALLLGDGQGGFAAPQTLAVGQAPAQVLLVDVDGDNALDLVTLNAADHTVSVRLNQGQGGFAPAVTTAVPDDVVRIALSELVGEEPADLLAVRRDSDQLQLYAGQGDGTFTLQASLAVGDGPVDLKVDDLDGDRRLDVAVLNGGENTVSVLLTNSLGTLVGGQVLQVPQGARALYIADAAPNRDFGTFSSSESLLITDIDGTKIKFKLSGAGQGRVTKDAFGRIIVDVAGSNSSTRLKISPSKGGDKIAQVRDIVVTGGSLKSIDGSKVDLSGRISVLDGSVDKITLRDVQADSGITIGAGAAKDTVQIKMRNVQDTSVNSLTPIKSIKVTQWLDPNAASQPDVVAAPWVDAVSSSGDLAAGFDLTGVGAPKGIALSSVKADILRAGRYRVQQGDINSVSAVEIVEGVRFLAPQGAVRKLKVKYDATFLMEARRSDTITIGRDAVDTVIRLTQVSDDGTRALKTLKISGVADNLTFSSRGNVDTIDAAVLRDSRIYLGIDTLTTNPEFPAADSNPFAGPALLKLIKTRKQKEDAPSFDDSVVVAPTIRTADLQRVRFDNNNIDFGVLADSIDSLSFSDVEDSRFKLKLTDLDTPQDLADQVSDLSRLDDMKIRLIEVDG